MDERYPCAIVLLTICGPFSFPRLCQGFPHVHMSGPWMVDSDFVYSGACVFPVIDGDRSWSINITFDRPINNFTFFNVLELVEDEEGYWVCVKNQFNQSPDPEFSVLFHARYSEDKPDVPTGECFVLKNNDTHCLQNDPGSSRPPNVTAEMSRMVSETTTFIEETSVENISSVTGLLPLYTTTIPTLSPDKHTTRSQNLSESVCKCVCSYSEMTNSFAKVLQELAINKKSLSSERRRKISAEDNRTSSKVMGSVGILVIVFVVCFIGLLDIKTFWSQIKCKIVLKNNT